MTALEACTAPDLALTRWERFAELAAQGEPWRGVLGLDRAVRHLTTLFAHSRSLGEALLCNPDWVEVFREEGRLERFKPLAAYRREVTEAAGSADDETAARNALCLYRRREQMRIAVRDAGGLAPMGETARELADLAQAIIEAVHRLAWARLAERYGVPRMETAAGAGAGPEAGLCVIAMGKLGGSELNFFSDVDLVFVYDAEGETEGRREGERIVARETNHRFFVRLGEHMIRLLSEPGPNGFLYHVDMRLRPEGATGPLARSLDSFLAYLLQQARDWERVAYLKARVILGPLTLADRLHRSIQAFVYRDAEPVLVVTEMRQLKQRIDHEVTQTDAYHRDVKRGFGGIREIEFLVSGLQILFGQQYPALRARRLLTGLRRIQEAGIMPAAEANALQRAYEFLRRVEHRLQMYDELQTHEIPASVKKRARLARALGYASIGEFDAEYRQITHDVHARFAEFFESDIRASEQEIETLVRLLDDETDGEHAAEVLARYHLTHPSTAKLIRDLGRGTSEVFISAEGQRSFEQMLPALLRLAAQAPDPDGVLPRFHSFVLAMRGITYYYEILAQYPDVLRMLVMLFGTSETLSAELTGQPEFFDALVASRVLQLPATEELIAERMQAAARGRRKFADGAADLRRAARFEQLTAALRFLLGLATVRETFDHLSVAAEIAVRESLGLSVNRLLGLLEQRGLEGAAVRAGEVVRRLAADDFAVIAFGKLGGRETSFFSDLDLVFVCRETEGDMPEELGGIVSAREFFTFLSEGMVAVLGDPAIRGRGYELDARLRPHGRNAPMVVSAVAYERYVLEEAAVWELLALTRARTVCGPEQFRQQVLRAVVARARHLDGGTLRTELIAMRRRLEESVAADEAAVEFKRSPGGLVDLEFLVQGCLLRHPDLLIEAAGEPYWELFAWLAARDALGVGPAAALSATYSILRELELWLRLLTGKALSAVPREGPVLRTLERGLASVSQDTLDSIVERVKARNRTLFWEVLGLVNPDE